MGIFGSRKQMTTSSTPHRECRLLTLFVWIMHKCTTGVRGFSTAHYWWWWGPLCQLLFFACLWYLWPWIVKHCKRLIYKHLEGFNGCLCPLIVHYFIQQLTSGNFVGYKIVVFASFRMLCIYFIKLAVDLQRLYKPTGTGLENGPSTKKRSHLEKQRNRRLSYKWFCVKKRTFVYT